MGSCNEALDLAFGEGESCRPLWTEGLQILALCQQLELLRDDHHVISALLDRDHQRPDDPLWAHWFDEVAHDRGLAWRQGGGFEKPFQILGEDSDLFFLELQRHEFCIGCSLKEERAMSFGSLSACGESPNGGEVK